MKKIEVIREILGDRHGGMPKKNAAQHFSPANIALCKYWGKRDQELNLPMTSSLSVSLAKKGSHVKLTVIDEVQDKIFLNHQSIENFSEFGQRLLDFLNLFRIKNDPHFAIHIESNIPIAAGLASSASGFAAVINALNALYEWDLSTTELSILARMGSGSACRSIWPGFVEWHQGFRVDGMDSHARPIVEVWPELCIGLLILTAKEKTISSRQAMQRTRSTGSLYASWPQKVLQDLTLLKQSISSQDFQTFGKTAESNALAMHATMLSAWPPILYSLPETIEQMNKIWELRSGGLSLYFTQDAGPNLKLLFLEKDRAVIQSELPQMEIINPFH